MANEENPKNIKVNDKTGLYTSALMNDSNKIQMEIIKQWKKHRNGWTRIKTANVM